MIKAVIFDLDGVIVFTDHFHYLAWKQLADREGIPFDEIINNLLRGVSRKESLEIILRKSKRSYSEAEKEEMLAYKNDLYRQYLAKMSKQDVKEEVVQTLHELKRRNIKIAIGSSSKNARTILDKVGLTSLFDAISDGNNITRSKPDPEVFIKAATMLGVKNHECLVIEDATSGIDAAIVGGMIGVGIHDAASYHKTQYAISTFHDILTVVDSLR